MPAAVLLTIKVSIFVPATKPVVMWSALALRPTGTSQACGVPPLLNTMSPSPREDVAGAGGRAIIRFQARQSNFGNGLNLCSKITDQMFPRG
jgi:hypothetical protein